MRRPVELDAGRAGLFLGREAEIGSAARSQDSRSPSVQQLQIRNASKQRARLLADSLRVREVTSVVIGDSKALWESASRRRGSEVGEKLSRVPDLGRKCRSSRVPRRFVLEEPRAFLQVGAAAGGIDDHRVKRAQVEPFDQRASKLFGFLLTSGVQRQRSTTGLIGRHPHFATFRGQDPHGRSVHIGEVHALHATGEKPDRGAPRALSRCDFG